MTARPLSFARGEAVEQLRRQLESFLAAAEGADDLTLLGPSLCDGWSRLEVVVHVRMGLEEMAAGCAARVDEAPDTDAASYWSAHPDDRDDDPVPHILFLRRTASAYGRPSAAVQHLRDVGERVLLGCEGLGEEVVAFQGHRLTTGDFIGTWVVELAVHQLDLDLPGTPAPGLPWVRATLEALADTSLPHDIDDAEAVLAGLGRQGRTSPPGFPVSL